jgi:curved DNA-binding protein CbpA
LKSTDYFSALGLKNTCSEEEITTAFRNLALQVDPDKNKTPQAHAAFVGKHIITRRWVYGV